MSLARELLRNNTQHASCAISLKEEDVPWADGGSGELAYAGRQSVMSVTGAVSPTRSLIKCSFLNCNIDVKKLKTHPLKHVVFFHAKPCVEQDHFVKIPRWEEFAGLKDVLLCPQINWSAAQGEGHSSRSLNIDLSSFL